MKKFLVGLVAVMAFSASAQWQKAAYVQLADTDSLVKGIAQLGEFTGNAMLGMMMSSSVTKLPGVEFFGDGRDGASIVYTIFLDDSAKDSALEYAVLYPVAKDESAFIAAHQVDGCVRTNGLLRVVTEEADEDEGIDEEVAYVVFSKDGKWAAMSDKPEQAKLAIKDVALAERPMKGDLVKAVVTPRGMKILGETLKTTQLKSQLMEFEAFAGALGVDEKGLSVRSVATPKKDSKWAKVGLESLDANPFALAPKSALFAQATAANGGRAFFELKDALDILAKNGIQTKSFLKVDEKGDHVTHLTIDPAAAVAYAKANTNLMVQTDLKKLGHELSAMLEKNETKENPKMSMAVSVVGAAPIISPAERFSKILPDAPKSGVFDVQVGALYSLIKSLIPLALAEMSAAEQKQMKTALSLLPSEGQGGLAAVSWREAEKVRMLIRISADEFKCVSGLFAAFTTYTMQKQMKSNHDD